MSALWLSRMTLKQDAPVAALARLLVPDAANARAAAAHRLVWSLFADDPMRTRDFLWREEAPGRFLALSPRPPHDATGLFKVESKAFEPALSVGDRLGFALRANPVISRSAGPGQRGKRHDVVMDALHGIPGSEQRAGARPEAIVAAGQAWLSRQGVSHGFELYGQVAVDGYDRRQIARGDARPAMFGVVDFGGVLKVQDPSRFLAAVASGFGRARAFGCGLMLIRRI